MGGVLYDLGDQECLKGLGNCAVYPKSAQLPSGRLVAAFENAVVAPSGSADGETLPVHKSDDHGTSWQHLTEVPAPAYLSSDPAYDRYISHWGSPYLYALPERVGDLAAGTLLLASIVTGDDHYYLERKAADPNWVPTNDGDRSDMALALYASDDDGANWRVVNIIAEGGWQGGSAGAIGQNVAEANEYRQVDPIWEPFLMVYEGRLVAFYSDENDYIGVDASGVAILDPANDTAPDSHGQILAHRTWDGTGNDWSGPVVDVSGLRQDMGGGKTEIGGGRPGMTTVAPTTDGKWIMTYEYWGGGANVRYKVADSPLEFRSVGGEAGWEIGSLPVAGGSGPLATGGSPVLINLPDGRIVYNASGSASVWVNETGSSTGVWTEHQTNIGAGYSRTLQYVEETGRVVILQGVWGGPTTPAVIRFGEVDLGDSAGAYYRLVNRRTGQVLGTGGNTTDANIGNGDVPDVVLEDAGATSDLDTQYWHLATKGEESVTLLNKSGGRAAGIWTGSAAAGQRIGQWVDDTATGTWNLVPTSDGHYRLQSTADPGLYLTGAQDAAATLEYSVDDGSQEWSLEEGTGSGASVSLVARHSGKCVDVVGASTADGAETAQYACHGKSNQDWNFRDLGNGYVEVTAAHSGKCLDVYGASTADDARVVQWSCTGGQNQQWSVQDAGGGFVRLVARHSGKCLDVPQHSTADGALLAQYTCNGGWNQQFGRV
ncbi:RICIN domain-containing protein [Glycomyces tenuis]|uniref:RICIN domain-containing protein n=1 Tax=Glycomyces tenuis TaxID=58116 RepID=UPI003CCC04B8